MVLRTAVASVMCLVCIVAQAKKQSPQPPDGSYKASCNNIHFDGKQLTAHCGRYAGDPIGLTYTLSVDQCDRSHDISNSGGVLICIAKPDSYGLGNVVPNGSYLQSCHAPEVMQTMMGGQLHLFLRATCSPHAGNDDDRLAGLVVDSCKLPADIANTNGNLTCATK